MKQPKTAKNKGGRPRKTISKEDFEGLCGLQCTKLEICEWFDLTDKTLDRWCKETYDSSFSVVFAQKRGKGLISLRRNQFNLSKTNATMCIWLGKNYLGQREPEPKQIEQEVELPINVDELNEAQVNELFEKLRNRK